MKMLIRILILGALVSLASPASRAAVLTDARITHIIKDVRTVDSGKSPRPASVNELVERGRAVRTGIESRTELLFNDQTITRLGANSHFSFTDGTRDLSLTRGVLLLQVPKGVGGARIQTAAVTAGITGTTVLLEVSRLFTKLIVIEGKAILTPKAGNSRRKTVVSAGQEVIMPNTATEVPAPLDIDLRILVKTSRLLAGKWGTQLEQGRMAAAIAAQVRQTPGESGIAFVSPGTRPVFLAELPAQGAVPAATPAPIIPPPAPAATAPATQTTPVIRVNPVNPGSPPVGGNP